MTSHPASPKPLNQMLAKTLPCALSMALACTLLTSCGGGAASRQSPAHPMTAKTLYIVPSAARLDKEFDQKVAGVQADIQKDTASYIETTKTDTNHSRSSAIIHLNKKWMSEVDALANDPKNYGKVESFPLTMSNSYEGTLTPSGNITLDGDRIFLTDSTGLKWVGKFDGSKSHIMSECLANGENWTEGLGATNDPLMANMTSGMPSLKKMERCVDILESDQLDFDTQSRAIGQVDVSTATVIELLNQDNGGYEAIFTDENSANAYLKSARDRSCRYAQMLIDKIDEGLRNNIQGIKDNDVFQAGLTEDDKKIIDLGKELNSQLSQDTFFQWFKARSKQDGNPVTDDIILAGFGCNMRQIASDLVGAQEKGVSKPILEAKLNNALIEQGIFGTALKGAQQTNTTDAAGGALAEQFTEKVESAKDTFKNAAMNWISTSPENPNQGDNSSPTPTDGNGPTAQAPAQDQAKQYQDIIQQATAAYESGHTLGMKLYTAFTVSRDSDAQQAIDKQEKESVGKLPTNVQGEYTRGYIDGYQNFYMPRSQNPAKLTNDTIYNQGLLDGMLTAIGIGSIDEYQASNEYRADQSKEADFVKGLNDGTNWIPVTTTPPVQAPEDATAPAAVAPTEASQAPTPAPAPIAAPDAQAPAPVAPAPAVAPNPSPASPDQLKAAYNKGLALGKRVAANDSAANDEVTKAESDLANSPDLLKEFKRGIADGFSAAP